MTILLFDTSLRTNLYPFTLTRAISDLRFGLFTQKERWETMTGQQVNSLTETYLQPLYSAIDYDDVVLVDATVIPNENVVSLLRSIQQGEALADNHGLVMGRLSKGDQFAFDEDSLNRYHKIEQIDVVRRIDYPWQMVEWNDEMIAADFRLLKNLAPKSSYNGVSITNPSQVFIHPTATLEPCSLNATNGPIYIGENALVMEGSLIRGPFVLNTGAVLKMGTRVYGATTIGPYCVAGGEIKNSIMMGYSNKAHDGYLGDSIIGEWCNLGAGTSNSNLRNNAGIVKVWNYTEQAFIAAGTKCGLLMGDYSRAAINTSFNTGTMVGVCCNVFDANLTPKLIPSFSWSTGNGNRYLFDKAVEDISQWMQFKNKSMGQETIPVLKHIFDRNDL